jgi:ABC-2 type transport system permease protein
VAIRLAEAQRLRDELPTELLANLTLRELRGKFKRSTLGWLWSVINPLASIAIYTVIFGVFLKVAPPVGDPSGMEVYGFFLVCGLLPWTFLANSLNGAASSIVANEGLVKKVYFPRSVLPTSSTLAWLANYGVELTALGVVLLVAGNMVLPWLPLLLLLIGLQLAFVLGIGLLLSAGNAYFRDVQHFLTIALNIWFYSTPILYPIDIVPERIQPLLRLNPMATFVEAYRDLLYHLRWPGITTWLTLVAIAGVSLVVGIAAFRKLEPRLAEEL